MHNFAECCAHRDGGIRILRLEECCIQLEDICLCFASCMHEMMSLEQLDISVLTDADGDYIGSHEGDEIDDEDDERRSCRCCFQRHEISDRMTVRIC